ncbi:hypothetical protein GXM_03484 [Nostoc sphaeroides CCNUC1]|uniref:Uncharacterized protein n=1 Tax=Nostoc sphaeroides CCNUC1 TaxID=2653204 RepID=A0A5P8W089_9NOSO|nr:hypothetical protein GXM_03484 [Nostoc sphaeroides CCNUC1]
MSIRLTFVLDSEAKTNDAFKYEAIARPKILLISPIFIRTLSTIAY